MAEGVTVGIVGDRDPKNPTHTATEEALEHAGASLGVPVAARWLPTASLVGRAAERLRGLDAVFCSPGSPYESMDGALEAIRSARDGGVPFIGTCGGFQHAVIEYARNVLGLENAGHAEYDPDAPQPLVSDLSCSPFGQTMRVRIEPGSKVHGFYGGPEADEEYRCNYGLAPGSRRLLQDSGLRVSGTDVDNEARIIELPEHAFYVATLFVPQMRSAPERPHPLISAFVRTAAASSR